MQVKIIKAVSITINLPVEFTVAVDPSGNDSEVRSISYDERLISDAIYSKLDDNGFAMNLFEAACLKAVGDRV